jgi:hypothetical protein
MVLLSGVLLFRGVCRPYSMCRDIEKPCRGDPQAECVVMGRVQKTCCRHVGGSEGLLVDPIDIHTTCSAACVLMSSLAVLCGQGLFTRFTLSSWRQNRSLGLLLTGRT